MEEDIIRVLYLDDEEPNLLSFKAAFRRDFEVHTCDEPHKAVRMLDDHEFHVVLSDQRIRSSRPLTITRSLSLATSPLS